jgi:flagellar hook assembly protein FlgD
MRSSKPLVTAVLAAMLLLTGFSTAHAQKTIDGNFFPGEWLPSVELRADNTDRPWAEDNDLINLYVGWDQNDLFVGVEGHSGSNNVFFIYIDSSSRLVGAEQNDYYPGFKTQSEGWDPDFIYAVVEMENGIGADVKRIMGDGSTVSVPGALHGSKWPQNNSNFLGGWEISIPWAEIGVATGGSVRVAAGLGWATNKLVPTAPLGGGSGDELGEDLDSDFLSLDNPVTVIYDSDNNGMPDDLVALADSVDVRFEFFAPGATTVNLAGTFNDWCNNGGSINIDISVDPMSDDDMDGIWTIDRELTQTTHEYKFVVNTNQWFTDPKNARSSTDGYGNSVLSVFNPLAYLLYPLDGSDTADPTPVIGCYLAKCDTSTFDLGQLIIVINGEVVGSGPSLYDAATRMVTLSGIDSLPSGEHIVHVLLYNVGGPYFYDTTTFTVANDPAPPVISHVPVAGTPASSDLLITADITDNDVIAEAIVYYRAVGASTWLSTVMLEGLEDQWTGIIDGADVSFGVSLEYYISAADKVNTTLHPPAGTHVVPVWPDRELPVITEHFASPAVISPGGNGSDDVSRISFRLSETVEVNVEILDLDQIPEVHVRLLAFAQRLNAGYHSWDWNGRNDLNELMPNGIYTYRISGTDLAGNATEPVSGEIEIDQAAPAGKLKVAILFHANQNLNYQGDRANDVCFNGLLAVLRQHPSSKFMIHFSGTLLHDLLWYDFRNSPSTIQMLRDGAADEQFEIVGSTYSQNIPYSTDMWDNKVEIDVHRDVIEKSLGVSPSVFWNAERCWKQQLVPLISEGGYEATWVETHILNDSGVYSWEHYVRRTRNGGDELIVINDDGGIIGRLDYAIDSGDTGPLVDYLQNLHQMDTYRDFLVTYCQDAEATGLWDYDAGDDPQDDWDNLDAVLTELESYDWLEITTISDYLETRYPTEMIENIVDGQAGWMVGPSQDAGWDDWFDYNENSPLVDYYRGYYSTVRARIQEVQAGKVLGTPAHNLIEHALRSFVAHQFEFGCIGCGQMYCQDWQKMETLEAALLAAEYATSPVTSPEFPVMDVNGDSVDDITMITQDDFIAFTPYGGKLLYWFDLEAGEQMVGNEIFMWGYYYLPYREHWAGPGYNDDYHYMQDFEWNAPYPFPSAVPFQRFYSIRKKALSEFLSINGVEQAQLLDDFQSVSQIGDTLTFGHIDTDLRYTRKVWPVEDGITVRYTMQNTTGTTRSFAHRVENSLCPTLLEAMDGGRESLKYWNGADTSSVIGPSDIGVMNMVSGTTVQFAFSPQPDELSGGTDVFALSYDPVYTYDLGPGESKSYSFTMTRTRDTATGGEAMPALRRDLHLNYPNPFNPSTVVSFTVPEKEKVSIRVYDVSGRFVRTLADRTFEPGMHSVTWDGTNDGGRHVGSGVYFCRMDAAGFSKTRKLVLIR